ERFQIIADELLVETWLAAARLILVSRPEAGGIRREDLVDQDQLSIALPEFKFRIGDDDAALAGVFARGDVNLQAGVAGLFRHAGSDDFACLLERDIFIVASLGLGGG